MPWRPVVTLFDTGTLEAYASAAIEGLGPVLTEALGHEILGLITVVNAPSKEFDTTAFGNVTIMDVEYEGEQDCPDSGTVTLVFGVLGGKIVRRIRLPAVLRYGLIDMLQTVLPED